MPTVPFDDREGWIWYNGEMVQWRAAKVHILNHGLHYASCVYEGERVYAGRVFQIDAHTQRLVRSAQIMDMSLQVSSEDIARATLSVVEANRITDGYVRPVAWRGSEQISTAARNSSIHVAIAAWEWPHYFHGEARQSGIRLQTAEWRRPPPNAAPVLAKAAGHYMVSTLAKHAAEKAGFNDALLLDWEGYVAEASSANIFFSKGGVLYTPTADRFLNGITRQTVIGLAGANGIKVVESRMDSGHLQEYEECFLTGTAAEITPVIRIDDLEFRVGPVCSVIQTAYSNTVRS
jgi:branched-chain amino acid aminotransferase